MKRYIAVIELDDDEEIVGDANVSYTYRCNGTNYGTDESVELKAEDEVRGMKTYEDGLNEAWECAKKMYQFNPIDNKQLCEELYDMGFNEFICGTTASEAIAKIKEYEEKQKQADEIKVGDEFKSNNSGSNCVIARISDNEVTIMWSDGSVGIRAIDYISENFKKTGRHFPQMTEVLKQMKEEPTAKHSDRAVADRLCMACKYGDLCVDAEVCQDCFFDRTKPNFEEDKK